ncbi:MAG: hypothetical protein Q8933_18505 [Bacteroidota bacterium]|nr:hypothetical protein [Bacteroidota bacterium]
MKKWNFSALLLFLFFLALDSNFLSAQTVIGKVYTKAEADKLYGPVLKSIKLPASQFKNILSRSGKFMKFRFEGSDLYILNTDRKELFRSGSTATVRTFSATDPVRVYSSSVVDELLSKGQSSTITIEQRADVMSVTDGEYTLENGTGCPPDCEEP